jgi:hypothetical protein
MGQFCKLKNKDHRLKPNKGQQVITPINFLIFIKLQLKKAKAHFKKGKNMMRNKG